jgi:hypothetical protein
LADEGADVALRITLNVDGGITISGFGRACTSSTTGQVHAN